MARPREKNISKWGVWKRQQRLPGAKGRKCSVCGKPGADLHHTKGTVGGKPSGATKALCRSCHTRHHNRNGR